MFTTFSVQPLLRGLHLDDSSSSELSRTSSQGGSSSPVPKSTSIFNRGGKPVIEALDSFENNLYLGTSYGVLLHYVIDEQISSESDVPRSRLHRRTPLGFGKKVVERIMVLPSIRIAIVLCDSTLSFFNLPSFTPCIPQALPPIKGVTAFCEDGSQKGRAAEDGSIRICVAKRRIIQFYSIWPDAISEPKELDLPNGALVATRWKHFVCVADANDFKLIDMRISRMISVLPVVQSATTGSGTQVLKPVCIAISENEFLLASATSSGQTAIGIFCSGSGDPVRGTLQWSSYPRSLGIEFPYIAALLRNNVIEVHNILDQKLIQTLRFDPSMEIRSIAQGPGLAVWMSALAHVLSLQVDLTTASASLELEKRLQDIHRVSIVPARILVAGKDTVSALVTTPLVLHADGLLQKGRVEEALLLSEKTMTTLSSENLHRERLQFELDYIYQKSGLIYLGETLFDDAFGLLQKGRIDPRVLISMFPNVLQEPDLLLHVNLFRGVKDQLDHLRTLPEIIAKVSGGDVGEEFLKNATDVFLNFLVKFRKDALSRKDYGPAAQATDTALLGIWVDNRDAPNLLHLIESKNCCKEAISEQKLKISEQHYALSIWYKTHKKYGDTLSIWKGLLQGTLIDSDSKISLQDMASLLMSLQDMNLVEDYGWWIVGQDESIGLKVFMPGDAKRAAMFDSDRIFARCRTDLSPEGTMSYLEYIVGQRKSESSEQHTALCLMYIESIARMDVDSSSWTKHAESVDRFKTEQEDRLFALALPSKTTAKNSQEQIPSTFLSFLASLMKSDPIANTRVKLCNVLQSSTLYDPKAILAKMEPKELLQSEKAIVLARMSEFEPALAILVNKVKDYQGAETFCLHAGSFQATKRLQKLANQETSKSLSSGDKIVNDEVRKTMFMALLKEYLGMDHHKGGMKLALRLLNSQSTFLHISEVIDLLPQYWSVEMLQEYLLRSLRRGYHQRKELQVVKSLCLSENLRISHELYQLYDQQGPVVITADEVCPVCGEAIADAAVFLRTPAMQTIHLHCGSREQNETPPKE